MTTPTWAECHAAGMTAREAAAARGSTYDAARKWASMNRVSWQPARPGKHGAPTWAQCHAAGMTAMQAAEARAVAVTHAYRWAIKTKVRWLKPKPAKRPRMTEAEARDAIRRMTPDERLALLMAADAREANARLAQVMKGKAA